MADEIAAIEGCIASAGRRPRGSQKRYASVKLSDAPENIKEIYSAVLRDAFHGMQRPRVPVNHSVHKMFYVALHEAFFVWCEETMAVTEALLRETGITGDEIQARKYYNVDWFTERVPRFIPKPSVLY